MAKMKEENPEKYEKMKRLMDQEAEFVVVRIACVLLFVSAFVLDRRYLRNRARTMTDYLLSGNRPSGTLVVGVRWSKNYRAKLAAE